jgi:hypothetical protein
VLSRRNLSYPSRRSSLNPRPVNLLQFTRCGGTLFYLEPRRVRSQKSQLLCNQANPACPPWQVYSPWRDSCLPRASRGLPSLPRASKGAPSAKGCKTPGVGVSLRELVRCTEAQKCLFVSPLLATLTHSVSRKSFPCHSYANTRDGGVTPPPKFFSPLVYPERLLRRATRHSPLALTPFRINTCKSVSKQATLTPFRINTYKKTGEGGTRLFRVSSVQPPSLQPPASRTLCATWRLYPLWPHSIAHTSCHHGGVPSNLRKWP